VFGVFSVCVCVSACVCDVVCMCAFRCVCMYRVICAQVTDWREDTMMCDVLRDV